MKAPAAVLLGLAAAAPALAALSPPAAAAEVPERATGLWEQTMIQEGAPPSIVRQCLGEDTDARAIAATAAAGPCGRKHFTRTAEGWEAVGECRLSGMTVRSVSRVGGDLTTRMRVEADTTTTAAPGGASATRRTVIESRRLGDCEPGQRPGDMILPDGRVIRTPGSGD